MSQDLFDCATQTLEALTDLDRLEARGTLRIALREAGLALVQLTLPQLEIVFEKVMPQQLERRAVADSQAICGAVIKTLRASGISANGPTSTGSDDVFSRLGSQ